MAANPDRSAGGHQDRADFVISLEVALGCRIDDEQTSPRWFPSVDGAVELIQKKRSERGT